MLSIIKKIIIILFSFLLGIFLLWQYLGGSNYFSVFDIGYYQEKFLCEEDIQCIVREYSNTCINKEYNGGLKPGLQQIPINEEVGCQCILHHCMKK